MTDTDLASYATVRQLEFIEAVEKHGSNRKAALALGVDATTIDKALRRLRAVAASKGYAPEQNLTRKMPEGFKLDAFSSYYAATEDQPAQWLKGKLDKSAQDSALQEFADSLAAGVKGLAPVTLAPAYCNADLLCVYPIGDPHFGLRAWVEEGGDNFSLDEAERLTCGAIDRLIASAPSAKVAVLLNLGDHFHADNQSNTTTAGTVVDVDGRWAKIQQIGLRAMIYCIQRLLEKHERVIFKINRGNHDKHSSYALALMVSCYFNNEPRVEVDLSPAAVWYYQFGKVMIGSTHGDTIKGPMLMGVMAADRAEMWGQTKHRYWMVGHVHHSDKKEYAGGVVEYFRTLAAGDAWHNGQGYRSGRDMCLIVMHKDFGEIERHRCDVGMLAA